MAEKLDSDSSRERGLTGVAQPVNFRRIFFSFFKKEKSTQVDETSLDNRKRIRQLSYLAAT